MLYAFILQVVRAAEVTNMRGGRFMSVEDIIFLMRKDKVSGGVFFGHYLTSQAAHSLTQFLQSSCCMT